MEILLDAIATSDGTRAAVTRNVLRARVTSGPLGTFHFDAAGDTTGNRMASTASPAAVAASKQPSYLLRVYSLDSSAGLAIAGDRAVPRTQALKPRRRTSVRSLPTAKRARQPARRRRPLWTTGTSAGGPRVHACFRPGKAGVRRSAPGARANRP